MSVASVNTTWSFSFMNNLKELNNKYGEEDLFPQLNDPEDPLTKRISFSLDSIEKTRPDKLLSQSIKLKNLFHEAKKKDELPNLSILEGALHLVKEWELLVEAASNLAKTVDADQYFDQYMTSPKSFDELRKCLLRESLKIHIIAAKILERVSQVFQLFGESDGFKKKEIFQKLEKKGIFYIGAREVNMIFEKLKTSYDQNLSLKDLMQLLGNCDKELDLYLNNWKSICRSYYPSHFEKTD